MPTIPPLPEPVRPLLPQNTHPGLLLDKYVPSWDPIAAPGKLSERVQRPAVRAVAELARQEPPGLDLAGLLARRRQALDGLRARILRATTTGPLTLHLARASALENAGICLHPLYGFVYLPGSGLKGMAHAFACEVWLPGQPDRDWAWDTVCRVFGWAPSPWLKDLARRHEAKAPEGAQAGGVVFHEAWPASWPRLVVDILNNHHAGYYQKGDPPGDWDNPVPVYFLAVPAGQPFTFPISKRREDAPDDLLDLAAAWLTGALEHAGAGAKTATGYGAFRLDADAGSSVQPAGEAWAAARASGVRAEISGTLELVTPAFLAGANQEDAADCELRPATLRGLLRWWWRTLHAGFVGVKTLAEMEAAVWGNTKEGGAVRITVEPAGPVTPLRFDKNFLQRQNRLPPPPNNKTTQGLWYHAFGMDDTKTEEGVKARYQRWFAVPGARWRVRLTARPVRLPAGSERLLGADIVLGQATAALWLLCRLGGAGAKCRKGFGSFADVPELQALNLDACREAAAGFREACGLGRPAFDPQHADSPSSENMLQLPDLPLGWGNYWLALDQVGDVAQRFAQGYKHRREKQALGLPRRIGHPAQGNFRPGKYVKDRHASPVFYHFGWDAQGLVLRVTAFPAKYLPDLGESGRLLQELLDHLRTELPGRFQQHAAQGRKPPVNPPAAGLGPAGAQPAKTPAKPALPRAGDRVEAELLAEKTNKGGWKAKHPASGLSGPIINTADVPGDKQPGERVELLVASANPQSISFRYPTAADTAKGSPGPGGKGPAGSPGKPPPKGKR